MKKNKIVLPKPQRLRLAWDKNNDFKLLIIRDYTSGLK